MKILVTGAAGFVGSHAVQRLHAAGHDIVATDLVEDPWRLTLDVPRLRYMAGDLGATLPSAMPDVEEVWHFAANADIPLGAHDTSVDIRDSMMLTRDVLESMREHDVERIVFPSSSAVYGNGLGPVVRECDGPLLPCSMYAAGKIAAEALISAYAHTFGLRGVICRLGNVVGGVMRRGIVRDFIRELTNDPHTLHVLGDGRQRKSYVLVDDVIDGMAWVSEHPPTDEPVTVVNLTAGGSLDVTGVATAVAKAMHILPPRMVASTDQVSWAGDQPTIELGIDRLLSTGWQPTAGPAQAVRTAAERMLDEQVQAGR